MQTVRVILSLFFIIHFGNSSLNAQGFTIENYTVDIKISKQGYIDVNETIEVNFTENKRGIYRDIIDRHTIEGKKIKTRIENVKVETYDYKVSRKSNVTRVRIGNPDIYLTGKQVYKIHFRMWQPFIHLEDHSEFLYNIIADWPVRIDKVDYSIELPDNLDLSFNAYHIITGQDKASERFASIEKKGRIISGKSLKQLSPQENITVAIKLPESYIEKPEPPVSILKKDPVWYAPLMAIFFLFFSFFKSRKENDYTTGNAVYYPPENLSPAEVGAYHDSTVNIHDLISLLPYWAEKGYIKIMSNKMEGDDHDIYFKKITPLPPSAPEYQNLIFDSIFKSGDLVLLSELKNKIYTIIYKASGLIKDSLLGKHMYDEDHYRRYHTNQILWISLSAMLAGILIAALTPYKISGIMVLLVGLSGIVIRFLRPKRSDKGLRIKAELDALKKHLEEDSGELSVNLIQKDKAYFEKIYPYAIALGVDKSWLSKMQNYDIPAPYWYSYYGHPVGHSVAMKDFSNNFSVQEIKSVFTSHPSSSGSGGGFSGGSAGGGFGGGGGGSW